MIKEAAMREEYTGQDPVSMETKEIEKSWTRRGCIRIYFGDAGDDEERK